MKKIDINKIEFKNLNIGYSKNTVIVPHISMELTLGYSYWLTGENGTGKSLLLKTMAGLVDPVFGMYKINNQNVSEMSFEEFLPLRLNIGFGFEMGGLLSNKSIFENIILPLEYHSAGSEKQYSEKQYTEQTMEMLSHFGITQYKDVKPSFVSGAVRRLACIIRAYILEPQLILLDDVTSGLSDAQVDKLKDWILKFRSLNKKSTLIVSTQDNHFMKEFCDFDIHLTRNVGLNLFRQKQVA